MKRIIALFLFHTFALWFTGEIISSFKIMSSFLGFMEVVVVFSLLNMIVKPILSVVILPFSILSLGVLSPLVNLIILYLLVRLFPFVKITNWHFPGISYNGFNLPAYDFVSWQTFIIVALLLAFIIDFLSWLTGR